jgi:hypothetical protein
MYRKPTQNIDVHGYEPNIMTRALLRAQYGLRLSSGKMKIGQRRMTMLHSAHLEIHTPGTWIVNESKCSLTRTSQTLRIAHHYTIKITIWADGFSFSLANQQPQSHIRDTACGKENLATTSAVSKLSNLVSVQSVESRRTNDQEPANL